MTNSTPKLNISKYSRTPLLSQLLSELDRYDNSLTQKREFPNLVNHTNHTNVTLAT